MLRRASRLATLGAVLSSALVTGFAFAQAAAPAVREVDRIVALVNSEPITSGDVRNRMARIEAPPGEALPPPDELERQVLERLILERTQIQWATEIGIRVDEATLNEAEASVARQNGLTVPQLHERLAAIGMTPASFRANLRNDILLQRVREREVERQVRVTELEIDNYLREQTATRALEQTALHLAQVLIALPDSPDAATLAQREALAREVARRARAGEDFAALAREFSDGPERAAGGQMGLRTADRYPSLFVEATQSLPKGSVVGPLRSGAGFHVLLVLENRNLNLPPTHVIQTRARHILLVPGSPAEEEAMVRRMREWRERIESGQARFDVLAREHSRDGSASEGGDLGWTQPGQFVPEFEQVMNRLAPGQVSEPVRSRFGLHLIQVVERREAELPMRERREWVRNVLREQKIEEAYEAWARELRARAFVEYRENDR